ncbi:MAG: thioredoxin [Deltaproteobacteria bacterium]|nr:thioredoxin [Deltaproteobacteria bacterium]
MPKAVLEVDDASFGREVEQSAVPVLVDFTAEWCAPCRALEPTLEALARDLAGRVKVVRLDVGASQVTSERFGVRAMPTLLLFRGGKVVRQAVGALPRAHLERMIAEGSAPAAVGA